ncbi:hypothetical protein ACIGW7_39880 [Streptomyces sp. NPDC053253]|uniref:hypothetical protein n=1 Tax=Streptomyces sp. NPDC053253 TaxID=3365699 RepID=UPI0037CF748E
MSLIATVTLPDGTLGVVHTESLGRGESESRAELVATLLHNLAFESKVSACAALRAATTFQTKVSFRQEGPWELGEIHVLCVGERCRAEAEQYEKELGEEHPNAPVARAWAAATDEYTRDLAQELATASVMDANLARLRESDPDAERIFPARCFTAELTDRIAGFNLGNALEEYGTAKRDEDRWDRFGALFVGTDVRQDRFPPAGATAEAAR